jgi:leucine-zipper of insertion element IS481
MKLHRNAKSTPASRLLLVRRVFFEGWSYAAAAEGFAVCIRTVAKWVRRLKDGGVAALEDASSRPAFRRIRRRPGAVAPIWILREQHGLPAWAIRQALRMPRSTVSAWLRRLGMRLLQTVPPIPLQRYEWPCAGDVLHVDIKPLGRIGQVGHRLHRDRRRSTLGWEYVHAAIDDHSRVA